MSKPLNLPDPISQYFKARNEHDVDGMLAPFDENAVVKDENQEHCGRAAIRTWIDDTTRKYRSTVEIKDATAAGGKTVVSGLVAGDFPGSPLLLDHVFTLSGEKITRFEIE